MTRKAIPAQWREEQNVEKLQWKTLLLLLLLLLLLIEVEQKQKGPPGEKKKIKRHKKLKVKLWNILEGKEGPDLKRLLLPWVVVDHAVHQHSYFHHSLLP